MTTKADHLDNQFPDGFDVGTKLNDIVELVNELKTDYTAALADLTAVRAEAVKLVTDITDIRTKYVLHLANGAHTAAANQTGGDVTAATPAAITAANPAALTATAIAVNAVTDDLETDLHA